MEMALLLLFLPSFPPPQGLTLDVSACGLCTPSGPPQGPVIPAAPRAQAALGEVKPRKTSPPAPRQDGGPAAEVAGATGRRGRGCQAHRDREGFLGQENPK